MDLLSRRSLLKTSFAGAGAIGLGSLASACGSSNTSTASSSSSSSSSAAAARAVAYQLSWTHSVQFGGTYLAVKNGYFSELGLDVTLAPGGSDVAGDANTVSGKVLMNISGADGVARSNQEGADLVIIGRQYQKAPATILSLADAALKTPEDLVGKKIGVSSTDTPALDAFLSINDMSKDDVQFVPTQYDASVLTAGQVDAVYCFYIDLPIALQAQGIEGHSMLLSDFGYNPMSQTYTVLRSSLEDDEKRQEIVDLFKGDVMGWQAFHDNPKAAAKLTVEMHPDAGLDLKTQKLQAAAEVDIMYSAETEANGFGWYTDDDITKNLKLFKILGIKGSDESLWDHSILDEVFADGPTI
ncbi:MAG: ABC transporter substrate-binding protein [Nocardioides sp.]|uniref:ABC transporter substrate-binding protein n=1 Tax=Nocardioides sp. TaxID=35761 RepID=UPI0039E6A59C